MSWLWRAWRASGWATAAAVGFGTVAVAAGIGLMATSAYLISRAAQHPPTILLLLVPIAGVRFFSLLKALARYAERLAAHHVSLRWLTEIKVAVFSGLVAAPAAVMARSAADWVQRLTADIDRLQSFFVEGAGPLAVFLAIAAAAGGFLAGFAPQLGATLTGFLLLAGLGLPGRAAWRASRRRTSLAAAESRLAARLVDAVEGGADWLAAGWRERVSRRLIARADALARHQDRLEQSRALLTAWQGTLAWLAVFAVLAEAAPLAARGRWPAIDLAVIGFGVLAAFDAAAPLTQAAQAWVETARSADRVQALAIAPAPAPPAASPLTPGRFDLAAEGLGIRYPDQTRWILRDAAFAAAEGSRAIILGPSGAGKSTLLAAVAGLVPYQAGSLRLGGREIRDWDGDSLRLQVTWIGERSHLFRATVADNLRLAARQARPAEMEAVLAAVGLEPWLAGLPRGLDTLLDPEALSGGERRRLMLARAFLRDTPWLVVDEPFAALDGESAARVAAALNAWTRRRGLLLVTHDTVPADLAAESEAATRWWHLDGGRLKPLERAAAAAMAADPPPAGDRRRTAPLGH